MTERIDHAAEALALINHPYPAPPTYLAEAQIHATLALVEQQRIANLITVAGWVMDSSAEDVGFDLDKLRLGIAGEVWEGLGLS